LLLRDRRNNILDNGGKVVRLVTRFFDFVHSAVFQELEDRKASTRIILYPLHDLAYFVNHPDIAAHASSGILIKNTISHYELPKLGKNFLQTTTIKVIMKTYELAVAAVYCPPRHNIKEENFFEFFRTLGNKSIAEGD
jgi:hypothetical protein